MNIEIYPISDHPDQPGIKRELVEKFIGEWKMDVPQRAEVQFYINHKTGKADTPAVLDSKGVVITPAIINSKFRGFTDNTIEVKMVATNARMVDTNGVVVYKAEDTPAVLDKDGNIVTPAIIGDYPQGSVGQYDFFATLTNSGKMTVAQVITMQVAICDAQKLFDNY